MPRASRYTDEDLARAVAESASVAGVMRILGIKPAGGSHFHISKRIRRNGLDTSHFLGQAIRRGQAGPRLSPEEILVKRPDSDARTKPDLLRRALAEIGVPRHQLAGTSSHSSCGSHRWRSHQQCARQSATAVPELPQPDGHLLSQDLLALRMTLGPRVWVLAEVVELADTLRLGRSAPGLAGSSPAFRTVLRERVA
jgi:hypothetical protein